MTEVVVSTAEAEVTAADGKVELVLPEEIDEDAMELVVSAAEAEAIVVDGTIVLVLSEVVIDADSPLFDVVSVQREALSTPLEKIRMQAKTAMP